MFRRPPVSIRTVPLLPYTTLCRSLLELLGLQLLTGLGAHEQVGEPRTGAAEVPDVHDRGSQLDVAHALAPDLRAGDLDAAALADDALEAHPLVLSAVARSEEHTSELQSLMRISYAVFCLKKK